MKGFLDWAKKNWLIVLFVAIVVIVLPLGWFFSSRWNATIKQRQESAATGEMTKVNAARVTYAFPNYLPGATPVTQSVEPNTSLTEWFKQRRDELAAQAGEIGRRAEDFNKGVGPEAESVGRREHKVLVEGVFPRIAAGEDASQKLFEFEDAILGKHGRPDPYQAMLLRAQAGGPADPVHLADVLKDMQTREAEKLKGVGNRDLTPEEQQKLGQALLERRLAEYQSRAGEVSFYAAPDIFPTLSKGKWSDRPTEGDLNVLSREGDATRLSFFFLYQWDLWVDEDILAAVRLANTDTGGRPTTVEQSPVKRIEKIEIEKPKGTYQAEGDDRSLDPATGAPREPKATVEGMVPTDPGISFSGRDSGPWNKLYDVRRVKLTAIVSSAHLPEFLGAIERANFMTVTDVDLSPVNVYEELNDGYYYGPEHVVRATIEIESVWLRSWVALLMPKPLKEMMGVPLPEAAPGGNPG